MTAPLPPETLAELRRLREEATPGPWEWTTDLDVLLGGHGGEYCVIDTAMALRSHYVLRVASEDATLIAAAVNTLPALLDAAAERDALAEWRDFSQAEIVELRAECDKIARLLAAESARVGDLGAERDALAAKVERVRALHGPCPCDACIPDPSCESCDCITYPCPTLRALDGEADR